ncbi:hypothetical protein NQZ68_013326 [Dissostichus eleginoides]|nr:hypothetical protein NQZ68_013326 [Dissostichus eleginoides]
MDGQGCFHKNKERRSAACGVTLEESYPLPMRPDERCYPDALLTPPCPWPQRRCLASKLRTVKNEDRGGPGGAGLRTCPSSRRQDAHTLPHPFSSSLYPANGNMGLVSMAMAMMLSLILRW